MRPLSAALLLCLFAACSGADSEAPVEAEAPVSESALQELVQGTWAAQAASNPDIVASLLDAPGGSGWFALFHGDLDAASAEFTIASKDEAAAGARLGLARVHLERARFLFAAARLHGEAALELARYRRDHATAVRPGAYDLLAGALAATSIPGTPKGEVSAFLDAAVAGIQEGRGGSDLVVAKALGALATDRAEAADPGAVVIPEDVPQPLRGRLMGASAVAAGGVAFLQAKRFRQPGMVDPRGVDPSTGVTFSGEVWDALAVHGAAREYLSMAWREASNVPGGGEAIREAVEAAWGGPVPKRVQDTARPITAGLPSWTGLFLASQADSEDWSSSWGGSGESFATRWEGLVAPDRPSSAMERVDGILRLGDDRRMALRNALVAVAEGDGKGFVIDLELGRRLLDRALRTRMNELVEMREPAAAKRLADRTLDPTPGSRGGAADSRETRISYRNDPAFLIDLARLLHRAGQTGEALSYVHPLTKKDARLGGLEYYLGRLDAARTIGTAGKASQL